MPIAFTLIGAVSTGTFERDAMELGVSAQGFRSMAVSPDGKYLAAGDSKGSLHIYDLHTLDYTCFQVISSYRYCQLFEKYILLEPKHASVL